MDSLADLLSYVVTALQRSDSCSAVRVLETQSFSAQQFALKVRAELVTGEMLQVRIYRNGDHTDYSYQLVRDTGLVMRWDNKEHFPEIASHQQIAAHPRRSARPDGRVSGADAAGVDLHRKLASPSFA